MFTPDTVIQNRYRIVRHLEGAQGEVYEAFDETQQQPVTVQVTAIPNADTLERIRHAANARSKSTHPSLPTIVDHFTDGEQYIMVTEWVHGTTLAERLAGQGTPFTPAQVLQWGIQLLDALMVLHRQMPTLAHGDVRAESLIETADGTIELLGTSLYAIGGTHAPTEDQDVYDVSATLYHLLTGVKAPTMAARKTRVFLPSADTLNPLVPASLSTLLTQGLSENEEDRFNSAYALQNALQRVQEKLNESATVIAPPPPRTTPSLAAKLQQRQGSPSGSEPSATSDTPPSEDGVVVVPIIAESTPTADAARMYESSEDPVPPTTDGDSLFATVQPTPSEHSDANGGSLFANDPSTTPPPAPDPFKLSFGSSEAPSDAGSSRVESERPAGPPPASEPPPAAPPPPPPPSNPNRLWFALGIGCIGAILCICCGLIGVVSSQWDSIVEELEAADITIPEPDAPAENNDNGNENNPFDSNDSNNSNEEDEENDIGDSGGTTVSVFDIKVGDCYQDPEESDTVAELTLVDCDAPHDNEIYAFGLYPAGDDDPFPDEADLDEFSDEFCTEEFEAYVGIDYQDSIYYITYLQPTEGSWEDGDREVVCILYDQDGPMEGSKKDSQE